MRLMVLVMIQNVRIVKSSSARDKPEQTEGQSHARNTTQLAEREAATGAPILRQATHPVGLGNHQQAQREERPIQAKPRPSLPKMAVAVHI